jgi:DNA-binding IclR family transcriptional regulator
MYRYHNRTRKMIAVYLDTNESVLLKSNDRTFHVLFYILRQLDFERNLWYADKQNKLAIMNKLGISPPTLDKHIASLKERNLIETAETRGRYRLNMEIFSM